MVVAAYRVGLARVFRRRVNPKYLFHSSRATSSTTAPNEEKASVPDAKQIMRNLRKCLGDHPDSHDKFAVLFDQKQLGLLNGICDEFKTKPVTVPTKQQLQMTFWAGVIPFLGFGFLDNALMIMFGDVIDQSFCVAFGFSTLAAAALGNTLSDFFGVFSGGAVEDLAQSAGFKPPALSSGQRQLRVVRTVQAVGNSFGIVIGCLLGMAPLLWVDAESSQRKKSEERRRKVIFRAVEYLPDLLDAEAAVIMMVDPERPEELYSFGEGNLPSFRADRNVGVMGQVSRTGQFLNIGDVKNSEFNSEDNRVSGVQSVLCMPIMDLENNVMGVVEVINKEGGGAFTAADEQALSAFCSHIAVQFFPDEQSFESILEFVRNQITLSEGVVDKPYHSKKKDIDNLYKRLIGELTNQIDADFCNLLLLRQNAKTGDLELSSRVTLEGIQPFTCKLDQGIAGTACTTGQTIHVNNVLKTKWLDEGKHLNWNKTGTDARDVLCVPVFDVHGGVLGVLEAINKKTGKGFNKDDIALLTKVSENVALEVQGSGTPLKKALRLVTAQ